MEKSPDAFRTISEVAELLETPAHVLRFWESRFPQIRPVKRAGGRRYYRPADVSLLTGIKRLLHDEGMTIRGVQKILREQGVRHVAGAIDDSSVADDDAAIEAALVAALPDEAMAPTLPPAEAETAQIIALQSALRHPEAEAAQPRLVQASLFEALVPETPAEEAPMEVWAEAPEDPVPAPSAPTTLKITRIIAPSAPVTEAPVSEAPAPDVVASPEPVGPPMEAAVADMADTAPEGPSDSAEAPLHDLPQMARRLRSMRPADVDGAARADLFALLGRVRALSTAMRG